MLLLNLTACWCMDHKDVLEEFIKRVGENLIGRFIEDKIESLIEAFIIFTREKVAGKLFRRCCGEDICEETDYGI